VLPLDQAISFGNCRRATLSAGGLPDAEVEREIAAQCVAVSDMAGRESTTVSCFSVDSAWSREPDCERLSFSSCAHHASSRDGTPPEEFTLFWVERVGTSAHVRSLGFRDAGERRYPGTAVKVIQSR